MEIREGGLEIREVMYGEVRKEVGRLVVVMLKWGVKKGDRVVIVGVNFIEMLFVYLVIMWVGVVFSSSLMDMGVKGIL